MGVLGEAVSPFKRLTAFFLCSLPGYHEGSLSISLSQYVLFSGHVLGIGAAATLVGPNREQLFQRPPGE